MITSNNKRIKAAYAKYLESERQELSECYKTCSYAKKRAMQYCKDLYKELKGRNPAIVSFNLNEFTYGFTYKKDEKEYFVYITKASDTQMALN